MGERYLAVLLLFFCTLLGAETQDKPIVIEAPKTGEKLSLLSVEIKLVFGASVTLNSLQATINGKKILGHKFQFDGSKAFAAVSFIDGIRSGRNTLRISVKDTGGKVFRVSRSFVLVVPSVPSVSSTITPTGGTVSSPGIGDASFLSRSFSASQNVKLSITSDRKADGVYQNSTIIFGAQTRLPYELRINTGSEQPREPVTLKFAVPPALKKRIQKGIKIVLFGENFWESDLETLDSFETFPVSRSSDDNVVEATLPGYLFSTKFSKDGSFEAVFILGTYKAKPTRSTSAQANAGECAFGKLSSPLLDPNAPISSRVGPRDCISQPGISCNHPGVDYAVPDGTPVLAMIDGRVEEARDGTTAGTFVVLRRSDGSSTAYLHLTPGSVDVKVGQEVKAGDFLALSGHSGGIGKPHLHVEYFPVGATGRVDAEDCIERKPSEPDILVRRIFHKTILHCGTLKEDEVYINRFSTEQDKHGNYFARISTSSHVKYEYCGKILEQRETYDNFQVKPFNAYCAVYSYKADFNLDPCACIGTCNTGCPEGSISVDVKLQSFKRCLGSVVAADDLIIQVPVLSEPECVKSSNCVAQCGTEQNNDLQFIPVGLEH